MKNIISILCFLLLVSCNSTKTDQKNSLKSDAFYKEIKATHYVSALFMPTEDDVLIELKGKTFILDLVDEKSNVAKKKQEWNQLFYRDLPHHYSMTENLQKAADILEISGEGQDRINDWPASISDKQYQLMYKELAVDIVNAFEVSDFMKGKYVITPNKAFWDITTDSDYPLLVDIISTYERSFSTDDLVHEDLDSALDYGILIFDALCNQRNPDNPYYYNKLVFDQLPSLPAKDQEEFSKMGINAKTKLPVFDMNYYAKNRKEVYSEVLKSRREELDYTKKIFVKLPRPPFFITKVM